MKLIEHLLSWLVAIIFFVWLLFLKKHHQNEWIED